MSHSSTLIAPRVSHRVSTTSSLGCGDNMALASDTLFDKFGLFDSGNGNANSGSGGSSNNPDAILPSLPSFEDLDFADLLEIKEEPITTTNNSDTLSNLDNNMDPFFMDHSPSILDDASLDSIKSDCMWSSVHLWNNIESWNTTNQNMNSRKRRRDVSLTLSECAEGLLAINHLDVNMLDVDVKPQIINNPTLGSSPSFLSSSFGALDEETEEDSLTSTASEEESSEEEDDEEEHSEDEEIDVVSTADLVGSSARTRHTFSSRKTQNHNHIAKIEAGRSLLKKQFPSSKESSTNKNMNDNKQTSILSDHSYFLTRPEIDTNESQAKSQIKGMLTPNESSEDEEEGSSSSLFATGTPTIMTTTPMVDKRKIAQAVQSLMKNRNEPVNSNNIKFKFRMKFKSTMAAANTLKKAAIQNSHRTPVVSTSSDDFEQSQMRERRKSASKNAFCPPPTTNSSNSRSSPVKKQKMSSSHISSAPNTPPPPSCGSSLLASRNGHNNKNHHQSDSEKCREIRDLHNSMERQRRVEQRNHLAYLKKQVPEVADVEKASKLTILRKAMEYCQLLANVDSRVRKERERELNRNAVLKKKLLELSQKLDSRRVTHSGRVASGWSLSRY